MLRLKFLGKDDVLVIQEDKETGLLLLPADVEDDWNQTVASIVKDRVAAVPCRARIEVFCSLEIRKQTNEYLINILMTEAAKALDELVLGPVSYAYGSVASVSNVTCCACRIHAMTQDVLNNFSCQDHKEWWASLEIF